MINEGVSIRDVMERTGVSRATYFRLKKMVALFQLQTAM
ncbi:hypothetical protein MJO57_16300 [Endozoicomonas sp. SCSIO W0465]|nr:hypothetical protein MJO57_16300 [Endozoicomonas sp. SCSIO W0465]